MENNAYTIDSNNNAAQYTPAFKNTSKPPKNPTLIGVLCGIAGLVVGGIGIYGLMQIIKKPTPDCPECNCLKCETGGNNIIMPNSLTTSFFALEPEQNNIVYSPLSIRYGLSLLNAGAAGTTKTQIESVLGTEELPRYENIPDVLSLANAVFIKDTYSDKVLPSYLNTVQEEYNSEVLYDDFSSSANMDNWVSQKTFGLIDKIGIEPQPDTEMVLANALAIQMDWQHKFDTDVTYGKTFYKQDGEEINATTMSQLTHAEDVKYYTDDNTTILSMPLEKTSTGVDLDFVAVMPEGDLSSYIENLNMDSIESAVMNSTPASTPEDGVKIYIPKFKFDYELSFKQDLQELGITQAFADAADFSAMTSEPLKVSEAVHKANIDFSEDGIKAAAITVFAMVDSATAIDEDHRIPEPIIIRIDHPFFFLIRDRADGTIWFTGAVYEPNLWADDSADYEPSYDW